jgi:hypothetical protein
MTGASASPGFMVVSREDRSPASVLEGIKPKPRSVFVFGPLALGASCPEVIPGRNQWLRLSKWR